MKRRSATKVRVGEEFRPGIMMQPAFKQHFVVSSGVSSTGLSLGLLDTITVLSGGFMQSIGLGAGAIATISFGGEGNIDTVSSGGLEDILSGGTAINETVLAGGTIEGAGLVLETDIYGVVSGVTLENVNTVEAGGLLSAVTIVPDGAAATTSPARAGIASNVLVSGAEAELTVYSGGEADGVVVSAQGSFVLSNSATASGAVIETDGALFADGGVAHDTLVSSGGILVLAGSGLGEIGATVLKGGSVEIFAGAASNDDILSGGDELVTPGGEAEFSEVDKGSVLTVESGGRAFEGSAVGGGEILISSGGAVAASVISSGGALILESGAKVSGGNDVLSGGLVEFIDPVISAQTVVLPSSSTLPGTVLSVTVESGGGFALLDPVVERAGVLSFGGALDGVTVSSGGRLLGPGSLVGESFVNLDQGLVSGVGLNAGVAFVVESGGVASGVAARDAGAAITVQNGGLGVGLEELAALTRITVAHGGVTSRTVIDAGADALVFGVASAERLSGGTEYVETGGVTQGAVVLSGGLEEVARGGKASGTVIGKGGHEVAASGGAVVGAQLFNGGSLVVSSGGAVSGGLTIHGGQATIEGAMAAGQTVSFAGAAGTLTLGNLAAFHAKISGLSVAAEKIDLGGFASGGGETVSWAQTGTSGTLTVHDGAKTARLTLIGSYATSQFTLATDGHGGTLIADPHAAPGAAPAATRFAQAAAGLEPGRGAPFAAIHAGGTALSNAAPLVTTAMSGR